MRVVWSVRAVAELQDVVTYISQDRPGTARRMGQRIRAAVRRLGRYPLSGRIVPEFSRHDYREVIVGPYRVLYRVATDAVRILAVVHGSRDLPSLFPFEET